MSYSITGDSIEAVAYALMEQIREEANLAGKPIRTEADILDLYARCIHTVKTGTGKGLRAP